jgi:asparagine synthase (glutamine-hydrolysing)
MGLLEMCGIAGIVHPARERRIDIAGVTRGMTLRLAHRGPDDHGVWADEEAGIALGHRRLAIIDPSPAGHQPMLSSDGRFAISFNGELYNYRELRKELDLAGAGAVWRSDSDTEVVLEAIRFWGLGKALSRFIGMFAFAVWDKASRTLLLARDRVGEKPLYYGWLGPAFCFASELKAFQGVPDWNRRIDGESAGLFFRLGYVPAPKSIYLGVRKLEPGCYLSLSREDCSRTLFPETRRYWSLPHPEPSAGQPAPGHDSAYFERALEEHLAVAVRRQLVADVPVGALLSGGVDSSTIVALAQSMASQRMQTYTVAFHESAHSEGHYARAIANHLGTDHTELYVTPLDALKVVPQLPAIYDEPLSDPSQIPTFLVSKLASRYVKVCLSGDGGDELFGGYNRHIWGSRIPSWLAWFPPHARQRFVDAALEWFARSRFHRPDGQGGAVTASTMGQLQKLGSAIAASTPKDAYLSLTSHWKAEERILRNPVDVDAFAQAWDPGRDPVREMLFMDASSYLPGDILVKLDRATMAVGLEARAPYLDHELVEFASTIPIRENVGLTTGKKLLRKVLYGKVPKQLVDRPKMGFSLPLDHWLRGPLRSWVESMISSHSLSRHGLLREDIVRARWDEHLAGRRDHGTALWDVITFQSWYEANFTNG